MTSSSGEVKTISLCLYAQGERPDAALRVIDSLRASPGLGSTWELLIATNTPRYDLREYISAEHRSDRKIIWIESGTTRHQAALWRALMCNSTARWIVLLNDQIALDPAWHEKLINFLKASEGLDVIALGAGDAEHDTATLKARGFILKTSWLRARLRSEATSHTLSVVPLSEIKSLGLVEFHGGELISLLTLLDESGAASGKDSPSVSACLCAYGDHPELVLRCVDSIMAENISSSDFELLIGCNNVSREVMSQLERRALHSPFSLLIRSPYNLNKSGMQRITFRLARAALILSLDDDMYFLPGWFSAMRSFISSNGSFDVAGRLHTLTNRGWWSGKKRPYDQFARRKRWWQGKTPHGIEVHFPAGQCFLARREFVLLHDYPDCGMRIDWDDVLLGDLVAQVDGTQVAFSDELTKRIVVDEIASRGQHGGG